MFLTNKIGNETFLIEVKHWKRNFLENPGNYKNSKTKLCWNYANFEILLSNFIKLEVNDFKWKTTTVRKIHENPGIFWKL